MLPAARGKGVVVRTNANHGDLRMTATNDYLPNGTNVLNTDDGEVGTILNGFAFDPGIGWTEYEVVTRYGFERWQRDGMIPMSELETA
jgi:hypothetical protein